MEKNPKGTFVNLVDFPPIRPGKEAEFLEWFRWTNELYAKHKGFISRTLLKPTEGSPNYAAIVEHASKETFMAMHLSKDREEALNGWNRCLMVAQRHIFTKWLSLARSDEKEAHYDPF
jgi:antibiotic biosynthesis monooxygenase (ABM) superfamily enzyme